MEAALIFLASASLVYFTNEDYIGFNPHNPISDPFTIFSFLLFFYRIYNGDIIYCAIADKLGLNRITHSQYFLLKFKKKIDSTILSFQSLVFIFLALTVYVPKLYIVFYEVLLGINIIWLIYQQHCFSLMKVCITEKSLNRTKGYAHKVVLKRTRNLEKLSQLIRGWQINNFIFFIAIGVVILINRDINDYSAIALAITFTIVNSIIDLFTTQRLYYCNSPEDFFKNFREANSSNA